jgi:N-acyl-D-amino-acid deacylase
MTVGAELVLRGGLVADGTGVCLRRADVLVRADRIAAVGDVPVAAGGAAELDASGCVVAPGFINVLSHAYGTLQEDPRGLSDLYQGVTTEVFGEGWSLGPSAGRMTELSDTEFAGARPRLGDFLRDMAAAGVGPNVASFVGAHNLRTIYAGMDRRPLTDAELDAACRLLDSELAAGALGVGSALMYAPGSYASTAELIAYGKVLARHDALYISHIRDESGRLLDAVGELITIAREASVRAEIYHLKACGQENWPLLADAIGLVERARADGLAVTADVYPYEASGTLLAACIPPRYHEGGEAKLLARIASPRERAEIKAAIGAAGEDWENMYRGTGAAGILLDSGRTLADAAGRADPVDTLLDLVAADPRQMAIYFEMTEENVRLALRYPWVSVCSDSGSFAAAPSAEPVHPRAFGSFARVLGRYVADGVLPLTEAVRRMTSLPAGNLRLAGRGLIRAGALADLAVFVPGEVADHATYRDPHRYAAGMRHVLINGQVAFRDGQPTGVLAGRALRRGMLPAEPQLQPEQQPLVGVGEAEPEQFLRPRDAVPAGVRVHVEPAGGGGDVAVGRQVAVQRLRVGRAVLTVVAADRGSDPPAEPGDAGQDIGDLQQGRAGPHVVDRGEGRLRGRPPGQHLEHQVGILPGPGRQVRAGHLGAEGRADRYPQRVLRAQGDIGHQDPVRGGGRRAGRVRGEQSVDGALDECAAMLAEVCLTVHADQIGEPLGGLRYRAVVGHRTAVGRRHDEGRDRHRAVGAQPELRCDDRGAGRVGEQPPYHVGPAAAGHVRAGPGGEQMECGDLRRPGERLLGVRPQVPFGVDHPDRAERFAAGPHADRQPRQAARVGGVPVHPGACVQLAVLDVIGRDIGHLQAENALAALLVDDLARQRGVGQDPLAEVFDGGRAAHHRGDRVGQSEQIPDSGLLGHVAGAGSGRDQLLELQPADVLVGREQAHSRLTGGRRELAELIAVALDDQAAIACRQGVTQQAARRGVGGPHADGEQHGVPGRRQRRARLIDHHTGERRVSRFRSGQQAQRRRS